MNAWGNSYKALMIMAVWVWATLGLRVKLPPQSLKTRILDNRGMLCSANPPVTLHATGVCGTTIFYTMTYSSFPLVRLEFVKYLMSTIIDFKEPVSWAVISVSVFQALGKATVQPCMDMCCRVTAARSTGCMCPIMFPDLFRFIVKRNTHVHSGIFSTHAHTTRT